MVKAELVGINVPVHILSEMKRLVGMIEECDDSDEQKLYHLSQSLEELSSKFTPEIIAASYARISRSTKSVDELVQEALGNVPEARKSNEAIIFGMGHHSVADHALFNFNITHASRLLIESIEKRRIGAGYTEKSQRYVTLDGDFVRPKEFSPKDLAKFERLNSFQNDFYFKNNTRLFEHLQKKNSAELGRLSGKPKNDFLKLLQGSAKEDARYGLSLATEGQLGCSYDGEAQELAIRVLKHGRLAEERELAKQLFDAARPYAPSLIQLTDADVFRAHNPGLELDEGNFKYTEENLRRMAEEAMKGSASASTEGFLSLSSLMKEGEAMAISFLDADLAIISALLFEHSRNNIMECYGAAHSLQRQGKAEGFIKQALQYLSAHDKPPRAFEINTGGLVYAANVSSSCFAQLKRHRMMSLLSQDYDTRLGFTTPPNIEEIGVGKELKYVIDASNELHEEFLPKYGKAAEYCLTNAHRRRVLIAINMRELYHFSRTREDKKAQWEIQGLSRAMSSLARTQAPIASMLLGGKHEFKEVRDNAYSRQ
ncbi:FAD-dependent thymidylate synthase [Candidatus Woesearchaeota archaeon]|nr:FAD-dependent thymidylate synthase [Candidatus Woesearchaeota archaeon]